MSLHSTTFSTPLGPLCIRGNESGIVSVQFGRGGGAKGGIPRCLKQCRRQLEEYFSGRRRIFRLPLRMAGTPFEQRVYRALHSIPFGSTMTYGELARRIGYPGAARAVGNALRKNSLAIVIPCHRVVPASGGVGAYAGGERRKAQLLVLEGGRFPSFRPCRQPRS
jgi:methylated-DNA-[protein]-cysteine S-methyltransferase